jgi:hypothetical protein
VTRQVTTQMTREKFEFMNARPIRSGIKLAAGCTLALAASLALAAPGFAA